MQPITMLIYITTVALSFVHRSSSETTTEQVLKAVKERKQMLGWPLGYSSRVKHLLDHKWVNKCEFHQIDCSKIPKRGAKRNAFMDSIRQVVQPHLSPKGILQTVPKPVILRNCDRAMGFNLKRDLSRSAFAIPKMKEMKINVTAQHASQAFTNPDPMLMTLEQALDSSYYFESTQGRMSKYLFSQSKRRKKNSLPAKDRSWLLNALEKTFGNFHHYLDSFQQDSSIVAHTHTTGWLYLSSGLKLWAASPYDMAPPARVQWSLPLDSWFANNEEATRTLEEEWPGAKICMQKFGDIVLLPHFQWHATVSVGHSVGIGMQEPKLYSELGLPPSIYQLSRAKGLQQTMDALWQLHTEDRNSLKTILILGETLEEHANEQKKNTSIANENLRNGVNISDEALKVISVATQTISRASDLKRDGMILEHDFKMVQNAMNVIVETLGYMIGHHGLQDQSKSDKESIFKTFQSTRIKDFAKALKIKLDFPTGFSKRVRHLLKPALLNRCDFFSLSCADVEKGGGLAMEAIRNAVWHPTKTDLSRPVILTGCEKAILGTNVSRILNRKALRRLVGKQTRVNLVREHASQSYTVPAHKRTLLKRVFDKRKDIVEEKGGDPHTKLDYYFDPHKGLISKKIFREKRPGWLVSALDATFGRFEDFVDSVQRDTSVAAHEHVTGWLYLASGLKLWAVSHFQDPPPALVQWALPLDGWASPRSQFLKTSSTQQSHDSHDFDWHSVEVCVQSPGTVIILPQFSWHATVSMGHTLAFGMQRPSETTDQGIPDAIRKLRRAGEGGNDREVLDALWQIYNGDPNNLKIIRRIAVMLQDVQSGYSAVMEDVEKIRQVAKDTISKAEHMTEASVAGFPELREQDFETVRDAMEDVLSAVSHHHFVDL